MLLLESVASAVGWFRTVAAPVMVAVALTFPVVPLTLSKMKRLSAIAPLRRYETSRRSLAGLKKQWVVPEAPPGAKPVIMRGAAGTPVRVLAVGNAAMVLFA